MNITRGEARQIGGEFYFYPGTDIATIEISSFHMLHCLGVLRERPLDILVLTMSKDQVHRSVYWEHYWPNGVDEAQQVHVGMLCPRLCLVCCGALRHYTLTQSCEKIIASIP